MKWMIAVGLVAMMMATGCIQNATLVELNKDGSGTVTVREFYSPQATQMMSGMQGMAQQIGGQDADEKPADDALAMFSEQINGRIESLGEGVKLTSSEARTNEEGWKGYQAVYAFADINKLNLTMNNQQGDDEQEADAEGENYTFRFTPGNNARLEIMAPKGSDEEAAEDDEAAAQMEQAGAGMMAAMAPMFAGMRLSLFVKVNGEITESNATHLDKSKGIITVMDLPMDKVLANPKAMQAMSGGGEKAMQAIRALDIDGVMIQDPAKGLVVEFK